jgi:negative regulator of replication initiation
LCGYKPTDEVVEQFITSYILQLESSDVLKTVVPRTQSIIPTQQKQNDDLSFAYKQVSSFIFNGKRQIVRTWRDLLIQVSILMLNRHQDQFSEVLKLSGRKRPYFSKNPKELRYPEKLNGTDIYVETNLSATNIMTLTRRILTLFGHSDNEWVIEYR